MGDGANRPTYGLPVAIVPVTELAFGELPALLRLETQSSYRPRLEAFQADFFAGFFTVAIGAFVDARNR